jgi:hypothetical protein
MAINLAEDGDSVGALALFEAAFKLNPISSAYVPAMRARAGELG